MTMVGSLEAKSRVINGIMISDKKRFKRLSARIKGDFAKKKFIGDIYITDEDYKLLLRYFRDKYKILVKSYSHKIVDPIFATALVQIGIRKYDGRFWEHVGEILELDSINPNHQRWIGNSFVQTLIRYNKPMLTRNERVNNILMHGIVSDYYAMDFFNFIFAYYNLDLERDLNNNTYSNMKSLTDVMLRSDNTGRTYWLVKQTASAVYVNKRGMNIRIRNILKVIDRCFWHRIYPNNHRNRMNRLFIQWKNQSNDFNIEWRKYSSENQQGSGGKSFSTPYIKTDFAREQSKLIIPTQLINFDNSGDVVWNINIGNNILSVNTETYQAVTGLKTEEAAIELNSEQLFQNIKITLSNQRGIRQRNFQIKEDTVRFFDTCGNLINIDKYNLPNGKTYSFTKADINIESEALISQEKRGDLLLSYFELEDGDIIYLPSGKIFSVGAGINEGMQSGGIVKGAVANTDNGTCSLYRKAPIIIIKISETKVNGTMIKVNNETLRMSEINCSRFDLKDGSIETGYIIRTTDLGCRDNDFYEIIFDVPNDRTIRQWRFALINNLEYQYENAPYIFTARGSINFNEGIDIVAEKDENLYRIFGKNSFNFELVPDKTQLSFSINANKGTIPISINIPVLNWKFDNGIWQILKPDEIWHEDFPTYMYFKYPADHIKLVLPGELEEEGDCEVLYEKNQGKGMFICDVTRFKSWLNRRAEKRSLLINLDGIPIPFFNIATKSIVESFMLKGDFINNTLFAEVDIFGKSNYFADLSFRNDVIADKIPIKKGKFEVTIKNLQSGKYKIKVYEDENDGSGFDNNDYHLIGKFKKDLINPYDLTGKAIKIKHIKKGENNIFKMNLEGNYEVINLKRINEGLYWGDMVMANSHRKFSAGFVSPRVKISFYNLKKLRYTYITFLEDGEALEFIYDTYKSIIVKQEEPGLPPSEKYRRYEVAYPGEYIFVVDFER